MAHVNPYPRSVRVASLLQQEVAGWLLQDAEAPWNGLATITRVELSRDMTKADIYVLLHDDDEPNVKSLMAYLKGEAGRVRGRLGRTLHMKRIPQLVFRYDHPYAGAARVDQLIQGISRESGQDEPDEQG